MTVADLLRGLLLASANDAAATLAQRASAARRPRLRRADEPPRARARADPHPLRQRDRPRRAGQLLERRGPGQADADPAPQRVLPRGDQPAARDAAHGLASAHDPQPQPARARGARGQRRQDRPHLDSAGYILVGLGHQERASRSSRSSSTSPARRRATQDSLALIRYGLGRYHRVTAGAQGAGLRHRQARPSRRARAARGGRAPSCAPPAAGSACRSACSTFRSELDGPLPAGSRVGTIEVRWRGRTIASVPLVTRAAIARGLRSGSAATTCSSRTLMVVILSALALASLQLVLLRRRAVRRRRRQEGSSGIA